MLLMQPFVDAHVVPGVAHGRGDIAALAACTLVKQRPVYSVLDFNYCLILVRRIKVALSQNRKIRASRIDSNQPTRRRACDFEIVAPIDESETVPDRFRCAEFQHGQPLLVVQNFAIRSLKLGSLEGE